MKFFPPPSKFTLSILQNLPGDWFNVSKTIRKRLLPCRFLPPDAQPLETFKSSRFKNEAIMSSQLPNEVGYVRLFKGAPLSVLMIMTLVDCTLKIHQLIDLTGYEADEILPALDMLSEYHFVERDNIKNGWVLSSMYALLLFDDERQQRRN